MKNLLFIFLTIPSLVLSQCPDGKANEYKQKATQYGDASYSTLAVYYYYKCQCENGIANRTPEQVNVMVDQYNGLKAHSSGSNGIVIEGQHRVQWINISKVSKCSNGNNSNSTTNNNSKNDKSYYNNTVSNATQASLRGDYDSAAKDYTKLAADGFVNGNTKNAVVGTAGALLSIFSRKKSQRRENEGIRIANEKLRTQNQNYLNNLLEKIIGLKKIIKNEKLISRLDGEYSLLLSIDKEDLLNARPNIEQRENSINDIINKYNNSLFKKPKENLNTTAYITTFDNPIFEMSLYSEPNINSKVKYKCPKDSKVKVIDNSGKIFFKVIVDGYSGYVSKHYLKRQF